MTTLYKSQCHQQKFGSETPSETPPNHIFMLITLATLCSVTAALTTTKFEARPRPFGSGLVVSLKRSCNTANQSSLTGAWGNISAPWPMLCFPGPAVPAPNPSPNPSLALLPWF